MPSPLDAQQPATVSYPDGTTQSAIAFLEKLISFGSVSSESNVEISDWCAGVLRHLGFSIRRSEYDDSRGVRKANLVAVRRPTSGVSESDVSDAAMERRGSGHERSDLAYFGHTDVVPANDWIGSADADAPAEPFRAVVTDDRVYGRGACDMKGSIASMLSAVARLNRDEQKAPIWVVLTADEEVGFAGAKHIVSNCSGYRELVAADPISLIGEPTNLNVVHAHKGIHGFTIRSQGRAGHSATTFGVNANEAMVPVLEKLLELCRRTREDTRLQDHRFDPPVLSWNFGVSDHSDVVNITPERSDAWVSFRPMPEVSGAALVDEARSVAEAMGCSFNEFDGCEPLWTDPQCDFIEELRHLSGGETQTVSYSTDGGVLSELTRRVVIGPGSIYQAHTVDEWISIDQLSRGIDFFERALRRWCT